MPPWPRRGNEHSARQFNTRCCRTSYSKRWEQTPLIDRSHYPRRVRHILRNSRFALVLIPWAAQRPTRQSPGVLAVFHDCRSIDQNVSHADRVSEGLLERGAAVDGSRIEDDNVSEVARLQRASIRKPQNLSGQRGQLTHRILPGHQLLIPHVGTDPPGKGPHM